MIHPDDYADQRTGVDLHKRHVSAQGVAFLLVMASGAVSVIAQWCV